MWYIKMLENENPWGNPYSVVGNCGGFPSILNKPELESAAETWKSKPESEGTFHRGLTEKDSEIPFMKIGIW
jgi:hypothetical protein